MNEELRQKVIELDKTCRFYGCSKRDCEIHHVIPRSQGGTDDIENLMLLCNEHHRMVTEKVVLDIDILKRLKRLPGFRWHKAFEWHSNKDKLRGCRDNRRKNG